MSGIEYAALFKTFPSRKIKRRIKARGQSQENSPNRLSIQSDRRSSNSFFSIFLKDFRYQKDADGERRMVIGGSEDYPRSGVEGKESNRFPDSPRSGEGR